MSREFSRDAPSLIELPEMREIQIMPSSGEEQHCCNPAYLANPAVPSSGLLQPNMLAVYLIVLTQDPAHFILSVRNEASDISITT